MLEFDNDGLEPQDGAYRPTILMEFSVIMLVVTEPLIPSSACMLCRNGWLRFFYFGCSDAPSRLLLRAIFQAPPRRYIDLWDDDVLIPFLQEELIAIMILCDDPTFL
jgi:hypothetical protein